MKTQSQINKRLRDYKNGVVDSPYRVKRWTSYDASFGAMEPGAIDVDRSYHAQCADLPTDYILWLTDNKYRAWGNAKDFPNNKFPEGWKVIENKPSTIPKEGWIAVFTSGTYAQYGHIGIVYNGGNTTSFQILEQNWNGWANKKPSLRWDNYYGLTHFIVPPVAKEIEEPKKDVKSAPKQLVKENSSIKVNTNHIKGWTMTKRGRKPKAVVIHNDAGTMNSKQYYNNLVNADYNRLARGIAHAYADRNGIWEAISEDRIAWHVSDGVQPGSGNFETYGIEVNQSMYVSDKDFLKNEQAALKFAAHKLKKWGVPANRNTVRLHNEFSYTACPHRSAKLHTGIDPTKQAWTKATQLKLKDYFIKQIRAYMKGDTPKITTVKNKPGSASTPANRRDMNGWKVNKYGTYYKTEHATFTPNTPIKTHYVGPFRSCPVSGVLQPGQTIKYDTVCKQDGHVWISYTAYNGKDVWLAIRTWDKNTDSVGKLWGTIK
ncbi:SH3 domain-containing protein [Staphylococcus capitis]|uniref:SH3 domain-containing protein n=2 Tax=Staphylococcus TaxID=1279 RepID=UPI001D14597D|nr:SH3 domain-containing protein [Staphylococcus capitis]MCC3691443.1 SH3 domain-containing protein [Staphylococcus capitis]MCC3695982.1 SH3 domain-containing protein [Staphylococcus capitis]MCC9111952.1 SH3 domain-containing protein [Staphylococcus capitis]DAP36490.1 MAG TPA: Endolysin [Caudoviricetes sp.]